MPGQASGPLCHLQSHPRQTGSLRSEHRCCRSSHASSFQMYLTLRNAGGPTCVPPLASFSSHPARCQRTPIKQGRWGTITRITWRALRRPFRQDKLCQTAATTLLPAPAPAVRSGRAALETSTVQAALVVCRRPCLVCKKSEMRQPNTTASPPRTRPPSYACLDPAGSRGLRVRRGTRDTLTLSRKPHRALPLSRAPRSDTAP